METKNVTAEAAAREPVVMVYITTPTIEVAQTIADAVVEARLAACANILPQMTSVYRWNGAVQRDSEVVLLFKTVRSLAAELELKVHSLHPYDCPCVIALPVVAGSERFLDWVNTETRG